MQSVAEAKTQATIAKFLALTIAQLRKVMEAAQKKIDLHAEYRRVEK